MQGHFQTELVEWLSVSSRGNCELGGFLGSRSLQCKPGGNSVYDIMTDCIMVGRLRKVAIVAIIGDPLHCAHRKGKWTRVILFAWVDQADGTNENNHHSSQSVIYAELPNVTSCHGNPGSLRNFGPLWHIVCVGVCVGQAPRKLECFSYGCKERHLPKFLLFCNQYHDMKFYICMALIALTISLAIKQWPSWKLPWNKLFTGADWSCWYDHFFFFFFRKSFPARLALNKGQYLVEMSMIPEPTYKG